MEILTREELVSKYDSVICDLCRANGYLDNLAPCSTCEGITVNKRKMILPKKTILKSLIYKHQLCHKWKNI